MATFQKIVQLFYNKAGQLDQEQVKLACNLLNKSGVIAVPTDTLYGIAAKAEDSKALERIYSIKGRDVSKPLAVCISNIDLIDEVADIGKLNKNIIKSLLPGPITVVLKRSQSINKDLNPNCDTIGVRVPDHKFILALTTIVGPLALTSANRSGESSSLEVVDFKDLWDALDCVFEAGPIKTFHVAELGEIRKHRLGSTVIDLTNDEKRVYRIIREGCGLNRAVNILTRFGYIRKQ